MTGLKVLITMLREGATFYESQWCESGAIMQVIHYRMMKDRGPRLVCSLLFILWFLLSVQLSYGKRKSSTHKLSSDILSRLTSKQFLDFLQESPRNQTAVTLFTLEEGCEICSVFQAEYEKVARASRKFIQSHQTQEKSVQFYIVQLSKDPDTRKLIESLKIGFVPLLFVFQPELRTSWPKALPDQSADLYLLKRDTLSAEAIAIFVRERTGLPLQLPRGFMERLFALDIVVMLVSFLFILLVASWKLGILFHSSFWSMIIVSAYCVSISGIHYSILHQRPWIRSRAAGLSKYIIQGSWREQLASEGALFSSLCFLISLTVVLLGWLLELYQKGPKSRQKWIVLLSYLTFGVSVFIVVLMKVMWDFKFPGYLIFSHE